MLFLIAKPWHLQLTVLLPRYSGFTTTVVRLRILSWKRETVYGVKRTDGSFSLPPLEVLPVFLCVLAVWWECPTPSHVR